MTLFWVFMLRFCGVLFSKSRIFIPDLGGCIRMAWGVDFYHGYHSAPANYLLPTSGTQVQYLTYLTS